MEENEIRKDELKTKEEIKKSQKKCRKVTTALMFTGLIGALTIIPIVSIFFSSKQPRKNQYIFDFNDAVIKKEIPIDENKKEILFKFDEEIESSKLFNFKDLIQIEKKEDDYQIDMSNNFSFYRTGDRFGDFFNTNQITKKKLNQTSNNEEIIEIDLVKKLADFNQEKNRNIDFKYFIQQLSSLKFSFSYSFKNQDEKFCFYNTNGKLAGYEIKNFFSRVTKYLKEETNDQKISNETYKIKVFATNKNGVIEKIRFDIEFKFQVEKNFS